MVKRVKRRYKPKGNKFPTLTLTGRCFLLHHPESYIDALQRGDIMFYMHSDTSFRSKDEPFYEMVGGAGYIKAEVYDGKEWQFLVMDDLFEDKQHHFNKKERPLDTYILCEEFVQTLQGKEMRRIYRSHYEPIPEVPVIEDDEPES